nr:putative reverse transcriptase domain-containing protein [Tanacetum cinerariifolium]
MYAARPSLDMVEQSGLGQGSGNYYVFTLRRPKEVVDGRILEVHEERPKGNLEQLKTMKVDEHNLKDILVVRNIPGVFPKDLSGLLPSREVEFRIDLILGAMPVSISPYHLAPSEMQELSNQLKEL